MQNTLPLTPIFARVNLKQWLRLDALTCLGAGLAFSAGSTPLAGLLGLPQALLFYAGAALFPCAALMIVASRSLAKWLVWTVILGNVAWTAASIWVVFALRPTPLGMLVVIAQAVVVASLALLERRALGAADQPTS